MEKFCEHCDKEVETRIVTREETYKVYGEKVSVNTKVMVCAECGQDLYNRELDSQTLNKVYDIYRKRHKLLSPEEIKEIRNQYGLSQREFAKVLNWGDKTIYRYENNSLQDKAHNSILILLKDPRNMLQYLRMNEVSLSDESKKRLMNRTMQLLMLKGSGVKPKISYSEIWVPSTSSYDENPVPKETLEHLSSIIPYHYMDNDIASNANFYENGNEYQPGKEFNLAS